MAVLSLSLGVNAQPGYIPSKDIQDAQQEFRDNKFGIFIHWGIYSMMGQGEWVLNGQDMRHSEYSKLAAGFYPANFNAAEWVGAFKEAGAKYICITSRHHDGFSMFDTKCSDYNIMDATPFKRDVLAEIAEECEKQGMTLHVYYSILDWGREDYPRGRTGKNTGRTAETNPDGYFDFMKGQLTELLTNYGKIGCIWLDGHWDHDEDTVEFDWRYDELYPLIHSLQPGCLVGNNHHLDPFEGEDIQIFERDVPGQNTAGWHEGGISSLPLETCQTMNESWGYRIRDNQYKSPEYLIKYLVGTAGRDANLLLNVGPQPDGSLPAAALERLKIMGEWLAENGETIYGTRGNLVAPQPWGVVTARGNRIFIHIFPDDMAAARCDRTIFVPLKDISRIKTVRPFKSENKLSYRQYDEGVFVTLPEIDEGIVDYIVEITVK